MSRLAPYLEALRAHYGKARSADPDAPFEPVVRAILSPGASPKSLEKALHTMRVYGLLDPAKIRELDPDTIALALKPAGSAPAKAVRLKIFVAWVADRFGGDLERLKALPPHQLREELLAIGGFSPEAVDALLLLGLGLPTAVVDTHVYRVLTRHELAVEEAGYEDLKELLEKGLPRDARTLTEFRDLTDRVGREFCRPRPRCDQCPLRPLLPFMPPREDAP
jgi:endonuclease-3 related protein